MHDVILQTMHTLNVCKALSFFNIALGKMVVKSEIVNYTSEDRDDTDAGDTASFEL